MDPANPSMEANGSPWGILGACIVKQVLILGLPGFKKQTRLNRYIDA